MSHSARPPVPEEHQNVGGGPSQEHFQEAFFAHTRRHTYSHALTCAHAWPHPRCFPGTKLSAGDGSPTPLPNSCLNPEGPPLRSFSSPYAGCSYCPEPFDTPVPLPSFPSPHFTPDGGGGAGSRGNSHSWNPVFSSFPVDVPFPFLGSPRADAQASNCV